jgi:histidinol-phosphate aminotransferase
MADHAPQQETGAVNRVAPAALPEPSAQTLERVIRDDVRALSAYSVADARGMVKLDAMENPYELPPDARKALATELSQVALNRYPVPSYTALKALIARQMGVPETAGLMLGNGSDELIAILSTAVARPGAVVLAPVPGFVMYEMSARLAGCGFVGVSLRADFSLDTPAMLQAIKTHQPAIVWLAYPNNPTGNCFDAAAMQRIVQASPGLVVVDEAYQPFAQQTWMPKLAEYPNMLVLRTVSKLGLAGIRLGYLAGSAAWIGQLEKVRPPYNLNVLSEAAALFALEHLPILDGQAAALRSERSRLMALLAATAGVVPFPSQANFILFRVESPQVDGERIASGARGARFFRSLRERGVLIKDVGKMHPVLTDCLRVTVGTPEENEAFVVALRASLA